MHRTWLYRRQEAQSGYQLNQKFVETRTRYGRKHDDRKIHPAWANGAWVLTSVTEAQAKKIDSEPRTRRPQLQLRHKVVMSA